MSEDLGEEDIVGLILGFEAVAADGGVGASQVAWFPRFVQRAEGVELRAGGGVDGLGVNEAFENLGERRGQASWGRPERGWDRARSLFREPAQVLSCPSKITAG